MRISVSGFTAGCESHRAPQGTSLPPQWTPDSAPFARHKGSLSLLPSQALSPEKRPAHFTFFFAGEAATENQQKFRVGSFTGKGSGWNDSNRDTFESDQKWFGPQGFLACGVFVSVL